MTFNPDIHHRHSMRLTEFDYSNPGGYFITVVTRNRECLFGDVADGEMVMNDAGHMIQYVWDSLPQRFPNIILDAYIVMPNHIHGILIIVDQTENTLGDMIRSFKSITTVKHNTHIVKPLGHTDFRKIWQRNYWEHVIRNEHDLVDIRNYIVNNPLQWDIDKENPNNP